MRIEKITEGNNGVLDTENLKKLILMATGAPDYNPPMLPESVNSLMKVSSNPNADFGEIERLVSSEPTIAAKVLAVANSALFSRGTAIDSIRTAISRLGLVQIRDLAYAAAINAKIFRVPKYQSYMEEQKRHAMGAGMLSAQTCKIIGLNPDMAFICGLLHDIGKAIGVAIVADWCKNKKRPYPEIEELKGPIHELHTSVVARVCALWNLPQLVVQAVERHHKPMVRGELNQMAAVIAVADLGCRHAGIGREKIPVTIMQERSFFDLNMSPDQARDLLDYSVELASQL